MQATNFEYDGSFLSDFGCMVCEFDKGNGVSNESNGAEIKFNKISHNGGKMFSLSSSSNENCIEFTFDICKDPEISEDKYISNEELRSLSKWLNRKDFHKLRFFDTYEGKEFGCYYNASFNISKIVIGGNLCGLRLVAETDSPFAYGNEYVVREKVEKNDYIVVRNISDEIGILRPDMAITCQESGDLIVRNDRTKQSMLIKNCAAGEVILIDGKFQIISTSLNSHDIANDFNYNFIYIENDRLDTENDIYFSLLCDVEIRYEPFIKFMP